MLDVRDTVDEASEESFPASDAPAWIMPARREAKHCSSTLNLEEIGTMSVQTPSVQPQRPGRHRAEAEHGRHDLETVACDVLIEGLNRDLAGEYQAVLMYSNYAA